MANPTGKRVQNGTVIRPCNCPHTYQDAKYGAGNRVMNLTAKGADCTVCGVTRF